MKKKQIYKTDHPTINEISIGDKFVLNNGDIVLFNYKNEIINDERHYFDFYSFKNRRFYYSDKKLNVIYVSNNTLFTDYIKYKMLNFKEKISLI